MERTAEQKQVDQRELEEAVVYLRTLGACTEAILWLQMFDSVQEAWKEAFNSRREYLRWYFQKILLAHDKRRRIINDLCNSTDCDICSPKALKLLEDNPKPFKPLEGQSLVYPDPEIQREQSAASREFETEGVNDLP